MMAQRNLHGNDATVSSWAGTGGITHQISREGIDPPTIQQLISNGKPNPLSNHVKRLDKVPSNADKQRPRES